MSSILTEYGPYTPQETDRISNWLKSKQIDFTIGKDEETEKLEMMNDGLNLVTKAEYRTTTYLGQIFYMTPDFANESQKQDFERQFGLKSEIPNAGLTKNQQLSENDPGLHQAAVLKKQKQRFLAALLAAMMIGFLVYSAYRVIFKEIQ